MAYQIILFDIDGTLCDPGNSFIESAKYALAELGIHETDEVALKRFIGPPLEHSFRDYYDFDEEKSKRAAALFREKLQRDGIKLYQAYSGITNLLQSLHEVGKITAIVTSKIEPIAKDALKSTNLLQYFDIIGAQQTHEVVDKEVILRKVLNQLKVADPSTVVMVGDRKHDIEAANTHNIDSIGVLWGYGSVGEFQKEGATHIVKDLQELKNLLT